MKKVLAVLVITFLVISQPMATVGASKCSDDTTQTPPITVQWDPPEPNCQ